MQNKNSRYHFHHNIINRGHDSLKLHLNGSKKYAVAYTNPRPPDY